MTLTISTRRGMFTIGWQKHADTTAAAEVEGYVSHTATCTELAYDDTRPHQATMFGFARPR